MAAVRVPGAYCLATRPLIPHFLMPAAATGESGPVFGSSPRILVIRLRRLGDLLLITPTLRAIRLAHPAARLDVLVSAGFEGVLNGNPRINEVLVLGPGLHAWMRVFATCHQRCYDLVLDLQSSPRSLPFVLLSGAAVRVGWKKRWVRDWAYTHLVPGWNDPVYVARNTLRVAAAIGTPPPPDLRLELAVSAADRVRAAAVFERAGIDPARPIVALSVVAQVPRKVWPLERYAVLADRLIVSWGAQIVLSSGAGELAQVQRVVDRMRERPALWNYGPTTIQELGAIYERCHLWIGNDGGPKHVATAVGCPTLVVIKPGDDRFWTDCGESPMQLAVQPLPEAGPEALPSAISVEQVERIASRCLDTHSPRAARVCAAVIP